MPYGQLRCLVLGSGHWFQSLIWVACPTGSNRTPTCLMFLDVSIPHMGCMPYGLWLALQKRLQTGEFQSLIWVACPTGGIWRTEGRATVLVSIPHMGCMPYGPRCTARPPAVGAKFQSLIWVACPTGTIVRFRSASTMSFQSLIWVACPTGCTVAAGSTCGRGVSIPHMGCMPYGPKWYVATNHFSSCFNPSYGLHALRACPKQISVDCEV